MVVTLVEARSAGRATRPGEAGGENRRRLGLLPPVEHPASVRLPPRKPPGRSSKRSPTGSPSSRPTSARSRWTATGFLATFPAPHPGDSPPATRPPGAGQLLDPPPCGYLVTEEQYTTPLDDGGSLPVDLRTSLQQRLDAHGIRVVPEVRTRTSSLGPAVARAHQRRARPRAAAAADRGRRAALRLPYVTTGASTFNVGTIGGASTRPASRSTTSPSSRTSR